MSTSPTNRRDNANIVSAVLGIFSDVRFLQAVGQVVFLVLAVVIFTSIANDINNALRNTNAAPNFAFLNNRAGFQLANAGDYTPDDTYWDAFMVGVRNTLSIVSAGLVGATVIGIIGGILLLSSNWLLRTVTRVVVEILRNIPLVIVIIVGYFIILSLPAQRDAVAIPPEGIIPLPIRFGLYAIAGFIVWRVIRNLPPQNHQRRALLSSAFVTALVMLEIPVWLFSFLAPDYPFGAPEAIASTIASYVITFAALIAITWITAKNRTQALIGVVIGFALALVLTALSIVPSSYIRLETSPAFFLSNRGFVYPQILPTARFAEWMIFVVIGLVIAIFLYVYLGRVQELTGQPQARVRYGVIVTVALALIGWMIVSAQPSTASIPVTNDDGTTALITLDQAREQGLLEDGGEQLYAPTPLTVTLPRQAGLRFEGGDELSENYVALLVTLVIYTAAFIAEIVRAGILAVPKGQIEAARAVGLNNSQMLRMVILPQALRVIIPPLTNQYLNLAKNSSLAIAIAYTDVFQVTTTIINQSGQSVTPILMIMATYLILSLVISAVMNWVNGRFQLKTR